MSSLIAQIQFERTLIMLREEAVRLNLHYKEVSRVGRTLDEETLSRVEAYSYFLDEVETLEVEPGKTQYWKDGKQVQLWNLYQKVPPADYVLVEQSGHMVDLVVFADQCPYKYWITKALTKKDGSGSLNEILETLEDKITRLGQVTAESKFNQKCNVHVGGGLIAQFNEVELLENGCTDVLQDRLNAGWRIIAACVQPDQRRPDYILGRYNPNHS